MSGGRPEMRVGIDATAVPRRRAGAGNYIFNLVRAIAEVDGINTYVIFARTQLIEEWNIRQPNFHFHVTELRHRPLRLLWEQTVLPVLARRHRLDVLHSPHYTFPMFTSARRVVTILDMTFYLYPQLHSFVKRLFFRRMIRLAVRYADRIITISESTANDLFHLLDGEGLAEKTHPVPLAVDSRYRLIRDETAVATACRRLGLEPKGFLLYVGVLEPRKNLPVLLRAFRRARDEGNRLPLAIVGKRGWKFDSIFATVQELGLENDVIFTGHVSDADLPYVYNGAALFLYPSLYEGFGLPVLEALSCGAPVITTNVSSLPEIVGDAGLLLPPSDVDELAGAIGRVLSDADLAASLSEKGRERAARFSWSRTARETIGVYARAAGMSHRGATLRDAGNGTLRGPC